MIVLCFYIREIMHYSLLRLLLVQIEMPPIIEMSGHQHPKHSRQEYLKEVFSEEIIFENHHLPYYFAPIGKLGSVLLGRIGRRKSETIEEGPETGFAEKIEPRWHAANFLLDASNHADGQKIAFEEKPDVGSPFSYNKKHG